MIYIGVTSDLYGRIFKHKNHLYIKSFSDKYNLEKLVFYREFSQIEDAIQYEKKIKKWNRQKKLELIIGMNPEWKDLYGNIVPY